MKSVTRILSGVFLAASIVWAQGTIAQISGTVKDSTGPAIPHAAVQVTQTVIGLVRTTTLN